MPEVTARLSTVLADRYRIEREIGACGRGRDAASGVMNVLSFISLFARIYEVSNGRRGPARMGISIGDHA